MFEPQEMATAGSSELSSYLPAEFMPVSPAPSSSSAASCFSPPILSSSNRFFIIKATNSKALEVSLTHGLWQFGNQTEKRLIKAIKVSIFVCSQRRRNYLSCCSWILCLMYTLSNHTTMLPQFFPYIFLSLSLTPPSSSLALSLLSLSPLPLSHIHLPHYHYLSLSLSLLHLPIPKCQYIIAADPGAGIGLVKFLFTCYPRKTHWIKYPHLITHCELLI